MNGNRKSIDNLFKNAAGSYRVTPSSGTWGHIEKRFFTGGLALIRSVSAGIILFGLGLTGYFLLSAGHPAPGKEDPMVENMAIVTSQENRAPGSKGEQVAPDETGMAPDREVSLAAALQPAPPSSGRAAGPVTGPSEEKPGVLPAVHPTRDRTALSPLTALVPSILTSGDRDPGGDEGKFRESDVINMFRDDYAQRAELGMSLFLAPGVVFYDPNPGKNSFLAEATLNYYSGRWTIRAGAGAKRDLDEGVYNVRFKSYDSIGYYNDVTSFRFADNSSDSLIIEQEQITVFDSVQHISLTEINNAYTYLYFPVSVSYRFHDKGRISASLTTGLAYSLLVAKNEPTVEWSASDASLIYVDRIVPARVRNNWLWSAGINLGYQVNHRIKLNLEPTYYLFLNDVYLETPGWSGKRPYSISIRAGIDFHF